jgi:hypothetical protein
MQSRIQIRPYSDRDVIFKFKAELFSLSGHDTIRIENPMSEVQDCKLGKAGISTIIVKAAEPVYF